MKLRIRQGQEGDQNTASDTNQIQNIQPANSILPDIPAPGSSLSPITLDAASETSLLVAPVPLSTATPTVSSKSTSSSSSPSSTVAPSTASHHVSHGLTPGQLTAAIVVPIGFFAVLIPVLVLWYLDHKRVVAARNRVSQRSSQRSAKAWEAMPVMEKEYRGHAPQRPRPAEPIPTRKPVPDSAPQIPPPQTSQTAERSSLGLFNFELSPSSTSPNSRGSIASPRWRLSIARALELRRSEVAVTQVHARSSGGSEYRPVTNHSTNSQAQPRPQTGPQIHIQDQSTTSPVYRQSETSIYEDDPPPPYMTPRPSEAQAQITRFAPLDRIGTRRQADRLSSTHVAGQISRASLAPEPQRNTYASSEIMPPESYGHVRTRSNSSTRSSEGRMSAHNNGPFSYGLPERLSDVSRLSFDAEEWGTGGHQHQHRHQSRRSGGSDISALDSDESSTMHPHQII